MLSTTDISTYFSPAALQLLANSLLAAGKLGKTQAEPKDLLNELLKLEEIKKLYGQN